MSSSSADGLVTVSATFIGLCSVAVGLRLYVRKRQSLRLLFDDWTAVVAHVLLTATAICIFVAVDNKSLGYSENAKEHPDIQAKYKSAKSMTLQIVINLLSTATLAFIKLSALFFYRRVFCTQGPLHWFDVVTRISIGVVVLWLFVFDFLLGFQCGTHFSALWDGSYVEYCTLSFPVLYGLAISDFLLDLWILALPVPRVLKLHASTGRKLSIICIFLLGFAGLGASIARMVQYIQVELGGKAYFLSHDEERATSQAIYFTQLEVGMSLVAVNLPSLWALTTLLEAKKMIHSMSSWISLPRSTKSEGSTSSEPATRFHDREISMWKGSDTSQIPATVSSFRKGLDDSQYGAVVTHYAQDLETGR